MRKTDASIVATNGMLIQRNGGDKMNTVKRLLIGLAVVGLFVATKAK